MIFLNFLIFCDFFIFRSNYILIQNRLGSVHFNLESYFLNKTEEKNPFHHLPCIFSFLKEDYGYFRSFLYTASHSYRSSHPFSFIVSTKIFKFSFRSSDLSLGGLTPYSLCT